MKSKIVRHEKKKEIEYPCLMESNRGTIVLFNRKKTGVAVFPKNGDWPIGNYSDAWDMDEFTPFNGEIILSNGE